MYMFINSVIGIVVVMVNRFYGLLVSVLIIINVSVDKMMIIIFKVFNMVIIFVKVFNFCFVIFFNEWLLWWVEINRIRKFCIVLVIIIFIRI